MLQTDGQMTEGDEDIYSGCRGLIQFASEALAVPAPGVGCVPLSFPQDAHRLVWRLTTKQALTTIPLLGIGPKEVNTGTRMLVCECSQRLWAHRAKGRIKTNVC